MRVRFVYILAWILSVLVLTSCSDNEILTTYEEVKEQANPVPLIFNPYINTSIESEATTRADLSYLTGVLSSGENSGLENFSSFPWFDETAALNQNWDIDGVGSHAGYRNTGLKPDYRFGKATINSYIVGIYGYYDHNSANGWAQLSASPTLTANFMTNQPLRHLNEKPENAEDYDYDNAHWEYSPLRYWPNSKDNAAKVSFISYYPFQDFSERGTGITTDGKYTFEGYYRDGTDLNGDSNADLADLTCITPPANDARGKDAYLFTFKQNKNISEHIDFLLGLDKDISKQSVGNGINLTLKHTLCAVMFDLRTEGVGAGVTYEINSVSLEGLYGKGKVYPTKPENIVNIVWEPQYLEEDNTTYTLDFYEHRDIFNGHFDKPIFTGTNRIRYSRQLIYQNDIPKVGNKTVGTVNGKNIANLTYVNNSRGMECLMLVIPQLVEKDKDNNDKDAFLVVNYNITYNDGNGHINVFRNNEEKIKLKDQVYENKKNKSRQLFMPGRFMVFNILFEGPDKIKMLARDTDWEDEEDWVLPMDDDEEAGSGTGGEGN